MLALGEGVVRGRPPARGEQGGAGHCGPAGRGGRVAKGGVEGVRFLFHFPLPKGRGENAPPPAEGGRAGKAPRPRRQVLEDSVQGPFARIAVHQVVAPVRVGRRQRPRGRFGHRWYLTPAMDYPSARYRGDGGEVSATLRPAATAPDLVYPNGTTVDYLATGSSSDGLFGLFRYSMGPDRGGPGPHFHRTMTESFYVLVGTVKIFDGRAWVDSSPGDFVHVPLVGIHGFRSESGEPVSFLIHFAPGGPREGYFEGLARFAAEGRPGAAAMAEFYARHDNIWTE